MRRRGSRSIGRLLFAGLLLGSVVAYGVGNPGSDAFTTATEPRGAAVDVAIDESGAHAIDPTSAVHVGQTDVLVNVTNHLGRPVTVTVRLRGDSTDTGSLVVGGSSTGNSTTFDLGRDQGQTVEMAVSNDTSLVGQSVYFHVNASTTGLSVTATDRAVPIES